MRNGRSDPFRARCSRFWNFRAEPRLKVISSAVTKVIVPTGFVFSNFIVGVVVVAVLYFSREILVPIALAVLLSKGWKDILWPTYEQFNEDRLLAVAAGVVFYGLLALFPTITALVSSYALFADAKTVSDHMAFLSGFLPEGSFSIKIRSVECCPKEI
jgi:hypothetical protein